MVQRQLRGVITVIDDCTFRVSRFDMLSGSDVHWWAASGLHFDNLTLGFVVSDQALNKTYQNESLTVNLKQNVTWDQIHVLCIWDVPTLSDFGHVVLRNGSNRVQAPSPSPADELPKLDSESRSLTMFDNCKALSKDYRVRWSLNADEGYIDMGLEAATGTQNYMAFGWANPNSTMEFMLGADVAVAGFKEEGTPFADDFYITKYSECVVRKDGFVIGVCPDAAYEPTKPVELMNNTNLVYGHRRDGISFIRYRRPLKALSKYDLEVDPHEDMTVIWALGLLKPADSLSPYYLPQNHGGPRSVAYGHLVLNVSAHVDDCLGPLDAEDKEDQDLIIVDSDVPLVVTAGEALHYPNPPNPLKVLYINKKEAPVLRVERGVPVKFSVQGGHDVAFYVTSDPIGGNATLRNKTEVIYAGGPEAEGVLASPYDLVWAPNRNTPDQVYYQSLYEQKMGWRVEVVDGGLSDMYNSSVYLDDQQVTFFWTMLDDDTISIAARGEKKSGYLAIAFGSGMVNSYAYVGWVDSIGKTHVNSYWIDGKDASRVHLTNENLTHVRCKSENGIITLEFTRPLNPSCSHSDERPDCNNIVDRTTPLKVVWAMGARWSDEHLSEKNMHSVTSKRSVRVLLMSGSAEAEQDLRPVLAVHGFMMFLAWGILLPGGILAARYLKHVKGDGWFQIHVYLQYSGLAIVLLALLFAVAELHGFSFDSLHVKVGFATIFLVCLQPVNAFFRPKKPANAEMDPNRVIWEYCHVIFGRGAIVLGIVALFTGMKHLGERYGVEDIHRLNWALIAWFVVGALFVVYLEYHDNQRRRQRALTRSSWVLGDLEEDDSVDLLSPRRAEAGKRSQSSERMEVQLEPLNR